jgi:TonB-dependent receptor
MEGLLAAASSAGERDRFGLALRCGVSALALCAVVAASPAAAQGTAPPPPPQSGTPPTTTPGEDQKPVSTSVSTKPDDGDASNDQGIVVTGIRRSLQKAQDLKRSADVVSDSITAEDIGALPDRSVTEALQRLPGVSISRFAAGRDPDHFSVEGSGVLVRGLTYVRSELNGRDSFTANNGRGLSFADVPAELMGGVDVFKSPSADMIEGGIAGTVNLRTRLPLDAQKGFHLAGSFEANWGDFRKKTSPTVALVGSGRFDTPMGEFGILGSFVYSRLYSRADGIQISNFGTRTLYSNGDVVPSAGATPQRTVYFPRGAAMRTQDFDRQRYGYSGALQWRSNNRALLATLQFLRSDARESYNEHAIEIATDNVTSNGDSRRVPGTTLEFDNDGLFDNGVITGPTGWRDDQQNTSAWGGNGDVRTPRYGLQSNNINRASKQRFVTDDYGANLKWNASSRLTVNLDYQHVNSRVNNLDVGLWTSSFSNVAIDLNGTKLPSVKFLPPEVCSGPAKNSPCTDLAGGASDQNPSYFGTGHNSFSDPYNSFYRSAMDHVEDSNGNEDAARIDFDYALPGHSWLSSIRAGYRFADRVNTARFSTYNWGVLSEIWGGGGPVWLSDQVNGNPGTPGGQPGSAFATGFGFSDFFRNKISNPISEPWLFYAPNPVANYSLYANTGLLIGDEWRTRANPANPACSQNWVPLAMRCGVPGANPFASSYEAGAGSSYFLPQEINPVHERNNAGYLMVRFDNRFNSGVRLSGNVGVRFTDTRRTASGFQSFPLQAFSSCTPQKDPLGNPLPPTPFCALPASVRASAIAFNNGALNASDVTIDYSYVLPSFNAKLEVGHGLQFRAAYSKGIAPPDFGLTRNYFDVRLSTQDADVLANGGLIGRSTVGNPRLKPITSDNFDLTAEWYFSRVGQLSLALFHKRLHGVLINNTERRAFTNNGQTFDVILTTPGNSRDTGKITGAEIAYQQTFTFLPGLLSGFGLSATYTYVKSSGVRQSTLSETDPDVAAGNTSTVDTSRLPLQGLSKHTINITPFYEKGPISIRLAYNWRSRFLLTVRDVIVPFAPIFNESTGQLDGSIFIALNKHVKFGVQAVNILNTVTRTTQVINNDLLRAPRSWFINDRRLTGSMRFTF